MSKVFEAMGMRAMYTCQFHHSRHYQAQRGASLIMVMLILVVVSLLGVGGAQIALMSERGARNDRDQQVAWQAAEAALIDAEIDMKIGNPGDPTHDRKDNFNDKLNFRSAFDPSGKYVGLFDGTLQGKPAWLTVDFTATGSGAPTTEFGAFTGRTFAAGGVGVQPAKAPRYIIEWIVDKDNNPLYRITAMGFGPRADIQAVLQTIYRI